MNLTWRFLADLLERAVKSFFQGYLVTAGVVHAVTPGDGALPAADQLFTVNNLLGGLAMAFMSIATSFLSKSVGNPDSASLLPPQAQPPAPKPADPTLEVNEAPPVPIGAPVITRTLDGTFAAPEPAHGIDPTLLSPSTFTTLAPHPKGLSDDERETIRALARLIQPVAPPPPAAPPAGLVARSPTRGLAGGRDPHSEGNT